jgi:hypothetical protein
VQRRDECCQEWLEQFDKQGFQGRQKVVHISELQDPLVGDLGHEQ